MLVVYFAQEINNANGILCTKSYLIIVTVIITGGNAYYISEQFTEFTYTNFFNDRVYQFIDTKTFC